MHDQQADDTERKVLRRTVLKSTAAGAGLAIMGGRAAGQDDETADDGGDGADAEVAEIVVDNQVTDGSTVEIESVTLPDGGFVSIVDPVAAHDELPLETMPSLDDVVATQVRGASEFLESGTHEGVVLEFDEPLEGEKLYQVWVHRDTTGDETFDYVDSVGEDDGRYPAPVDPDEDEEEAENGDEEDEDEEEAENGDEEDTEEAEEEQRGEDEAEEEGDDAEGEGDDGDGADDEAGADDDEEDVEEAEDEQRGEDEAEDENGDDAEGEGDDGDGADDAEGDVQAIELEGVRSGWEGLAPAEIEGETNPTLTMEAGATYEVTWVNGDGLGHNFVVLDEDGERLVETDLMSTEGESLSVEFEATEEMVEYVCTPHSGSMRGDVELVEGGDEDGEQNGADEEDGEQTDGDEQGAELHPTQEPNIVMGEVYLHQLQEGMEEAE